MVAGQKVLAIVLHGSGRYYLEPLFGQGRLPRLRALADAGHERYFKTALPIAAGAWVTLLTGQSVARHGIIDYIDLDARSYDGMAGRRASSADYADRTVHSVLSNAGRRVASIYLPMTVPPWPVNGTIISGFPLPDERRPPTYPAELSASLPPFAPDRLFSLRYDDTGRIGDYLHYNLARVEQVTLDIIRGGAHDVILSCIPTPDLAHHYFWRPNDPAALEHIYTFYDDVDATMGRMIEAAGEDTTVVVFSDHGGRAAPLRLFGVNRWLGDEGYLVPRGAKTSGLAAAWTNRAVDWAKTHRINHALAGLLRGGLRRRVSAMTHNTSFVDWSRTRAYGLDFICPLAGVEINLQGRQARGIVPRADYEGLRGEIIDRLSAFVDPETGHPVCARVVRREELFDGPHVERFPDVIGVLSDDFDVKGQLDLPVTGPNRGSADYPYMGYHGHDAYFCARGPGIAPGSGPSGGRMEDIAPTLLSLAGVTPPAFIDGRPFEF